MADKVQNLLACSKISPTRKQWRYYVTTPRDKAWSSMRSFYHIFLFFWSSLAHKIFTNNAMTRVITQKKTTLTSSSKIDHLAIPVLRAQAVPAVPISVYGRPKGSKPEGTASAAVPSQTSERPRRHRKGRSGEEWQSEGEDWSLISELWSLTSSLFSSFWSGVMGCAREKGAAWKGNGLL